VILARHRLLNMLANGLIALTLAVALACGGWWLVQRPGHALRNVSIDAMPSTDMRHVSRCCSARPCASA
jgi:hypothetical protein